MTYTAPCAQRCGRVLEELLKYQPVNLAYNIQFWDKKARIRTMGALRTVLREHAQQNHPDKWAITGRTPTTPEYAVVAVCLCRLLELVPAGEIEGSKLAEIPYGQVVEGVPLSAAAIKFRQLYSAEVSTPAATTFTTSKEIEMRIPKIEPITIKNVVFINGEPATVYSKEQLYELIANEEERIKKMQNIDNKPAILQKDLQAAQDGITALVKFMDENYKT